MVLSRFLYTGHYFLLSYHYIHHFIFKEEKLVK